MEEKEVLLTQEGYDNLEKASKYYFNKSASELTLAEAAFLAGINRAPNAYNPYEEGNEEAIKKVTKTVLVKMKELGMIETEEEYIKTVIRRSLKLAKRYNVNLRIWFI